VSKPSPKRGIRREGRPQNRLMDGIGLRQGDHSSERDTPSLAANPVGRNGNDEGLSGN